MAQLQAQLKRGILDEIWQGQGVADAATLEQLIRAFKSGLWGNIKTGLFVQSTSGGGYSTSFAVPELFRQLGPDQFFILGQEFLELYQDACTTLTAAGAVYDPEQVSGGDLIFATMMASDGMQSVRENYGDFTMLRWPTMGVGGAR